ncbi:MAG TPA: hypothetical protein VG370_34845 [Chloroflexota bacterium]|jgi:hypothetical protein|nr:hypothetical protein [Chloroflexota bacterium]
MGALLFDDTYDGPRWRYAPLSRPVRTGAVPSGWIVGSVRPAHPAFPFGVVDFPRELTPDEVAGYELELIAVVR